MGIYVVIYLKDDGKINVKRKSLYMTYDKIKFLENKSKKYS